MASSTAVSTINHLAIQNRQQCMSLEETYRNLANVFANGKFGEFKKKCKEIELHPHEYSKPSYSPVKFNSTQHKISSTTAKDYLNLLPDEDLNIDLKSLIPVEITNNGSALFQAAASLLGLSLESGARELRLRCLLDAVSNLKSYVNDYEELEPLLDPDEASIKNWSNFVHERPQVSY
jgi:hypothetical protein